MTKLDARKSGSFKVGGEIEIHRLGFGAMRITGKGIWGTPEDKPEAIPHPEALAPNSASTSSIPPISTGPMCPNNSFERRSILIAACRSPPRLGSSALAPAYGR